METPNAPAGTPAPAAEPVAAAPAAPVSAPESASAVEPGNTPPVSNHDVVKAAIASMENPDPVAEPKAETPSGNTPAPEAKTPEADPFGLGEMTYVDANGVTRDHRIPKSRVKEMIAKPLGELHASVKSSFGLRDDVAITPEVLKQVGEDFRNLRGEASSFAQAADMMLKDEAGFVDRMLQINPRYEAYLKTRFGGAQAAAPVAPSTQGMPQPNITLSDGSKTYDLEGLAALRAWDAEQVTAAVTKNLTGIVDQRLKPYEEKEAARIANHELDAKIERMFNEAMEWPGFKENQTGILAWLDTPAGQGKTLNQAYMATLGPQWAKDRQKVREEVLAEIAKAPKGTATPSNAGVSGRIPEANNKPRTNAEIVADVLAGKLQ